MMIGERLVEFRGMTDSGTLVYGNLTGTSDSPEIESLFDRMPVSKETIGEFTGLYDIDGTRIFEGDIVNLFPEVEHSQSFAIVGNSKGEFKLLIMKPLNSRLSEFNRKVRVIGNIFENQELVGKTLPR